MTADDWIVLPGLEFPTHALIRTNPKGGLFLGRCIKCGMENLRTGAALEPCENTKKMTNDEALLESINPKVQP